MKRAVPTRQTVFDYDRTVVAFHGTSKSAARQPVAGEPFGPSTNDDDWLGHGHARLLQAGYGVESCRAVFVPLRSRGTCESRRTSWRCGR